MAYTDACLVRRFGYSFRREVEQYGVGDNKRDNGYLTHEGSLE